MHHARASGSRSHARLSPSHHVRSFFFLVVRDSEKIDCGLFPDVSDSDFFIRRVDDAVV